MTGLALALALASQQPLGAWAPPRAGGGGWSGRIVDTSTLHVGVRPAAYVTSEQNERAAGVTVQVTAFVF